MTTQDPEAEVARAFLKWDDDRDGRIDRFEFQGLVEELAPGYAARASKYFDEMDTDDNKTISYDEFIAWWNTED